MPDPGAYDTEDFRPDPDSRGAAWATPHESSAGRRRRCSSLFVGYSGYYLCRSNLSVTKKLLADDLAGSGVTAEDAAGMVGQLFTWGTFAYAAGKFAFGTAGDLLGERRNFPGGTGGRCCSPPCPCRKCHSGRPGAAVGSEERGCVQCGVVSGVGPAGDDSAGSR